jgi:hypothetical protein
MVPHPAFPAGEVIAWAEDSAWARCVRDRAVRIFATPDDRTLEVVNPQAREVLAGYGSFLVTPMPADSGTAGLLIFARAAGAPGFGDGDVPVGVTLAGRAGTSVATSLALIRQHWTVGQPGPGQPRPALRPLSGLQVAARCLPAAGYEIGGDWYDIVPLPSGRTGLIVGDVMGHGAEAAVGMTQLSAAAHVLADLNLTPAEFMRQLNRTALALSGSTFATCAYAVIDPASATCVIATAGHLPPVLMLPSGVTHVPDLPGGQSLGISSTSYGQAQIEFPPGGILALYTDGLVENRTRPFDQGIVALRAILSGTGENLDAACDVLVRTLGQPREDDTTIVLARRS